MRVFFILAVFFSLQSFQSQGQASRRMVGFCNKTNSMYDDVQRYLRKDRFPWYVCLAESNYTEQEKEWTRRAMRRWNRQYREFKEDRWGTWDVVGIPKDPLFVEACEYAHGIMYVEKKHLSGDTLGRYRPKGGWFRPFQGIIQMDIREWDRRKFINVKLHELGHALGMTHLSPSQSHIMTAEFAWCSKGGNRVVCDLTESDFDSFLASYNPERAMTREKLDAELEHRRLANERSDYNCLHEGLCYRNGRFSIQPRL